VLTGTPPLLVVLAMYTYVGYCLGTNTCFAFKHDWVILSINSKEWAKTHSSRLLHSSSVSASAMASACSITCFGITGKGNLW
jgi:hypothetical protein